MCKIVQSQYTFGRDDFKVGEGLKERLSNSLSGFRGFRIQVSHGTIIALAALVIILFVAFTIRILPLRWENLPGGTALLNEFDPYYQFSITQHMVNDGLLSPYWPTHWINMQKWYPDGLDMSASLPALPMTGAVLYQIVSVFGAKIDLMTFCSILPAFIAVVSCLVIYLVGKDMGGKAVGLLAALFLALAPSFLQRSSLGFFDTEVPGVLGLVLFIFLFLRSVDSNRSLRSSLLYSLGSGAALAYFIAGWGAAYYLIALSVLFVFIMVLLKRYSQRLLINYSITFGIALFVGTKVPYISLSYVISSAILPVAAVFIVLIVAEIMRNNISIKNKLTLAITALILVVSGFVALGVTGSLGTLTGKFITVIDPFIRADSPLINSVAEQRIAAWGNIYTELGIAILFFLVGLYFVIKNPTNRNIFFLIFAVTSLYFAGSMIRLLVLFTPAFAIIAGIGIISLLKPFITLLHEAPRALAKSKRRMPRVSKEYSGFAVFVIFIILVTNLAISPEFGMPRAVEQAYMPTAISASSLPVGGAGLIEPVGAWLEAISYLKTLGPSTAVVMWWDYGNWLADLGNVTSLGDNTTVNSTQLENLGFIFMGTENQSMAMLNTYGQLRVKYIAVFETLGAAQSTTGENSYQVSPYGFGDEGKWTWMARISGQAKTRLIDQGFMNPATAWIDETQFGQTNPSTNAWEWNDQGLNCTVVELLMDAKAQYAGTMQSLGVNVVPDQITTTPTYFKPAYIAGVNTAPNQYGGLIPIIAIYEIDWASYNADHGITPP
jgi:dolichyl-diphosphooligosaccharide---protein glycosyltransferase